MRRDARGRGRRRRRPSRLTTTGSATAARVMTPREAARARAGRARRAKPPASLRRRAGREGERWRSAIEAATGVRGDGAGGGWTDASAGCAGARTRGGARERTWPWCAGGRCVRASSANDSARRHARKGATRPCAVHGALADERGARRKRTLFREAPPPGEIRRPCDPSVRRAARWRSRRPRSTSVRARAPPEPARGSPIAIDRTTRRGDPTGRSLLPQPARRRHPDERPTSPPFPSRPRRARRVSPRRCSTPFVPFGDLKDVNILLDHQTQKNRGSASSPSWKSARRTTSLVSSAPNGHPARSPVLPRSRARSTDPRSIDTPRSKQTPATSPSLI